MRNLNLRVLLWVVSVMLWAIPASAQDERVRISFGTGTVTGGDGTLALNGSVGYRFAERLSFEVDLTTTGSPLGGFVDRPFAIAGAGPMIRFGSAGGDRARFFAGGPQPPERGAGLAPARPGGSPTMLFEERIGFARREAEGRTVLATVGFRYDIPIQGGRLQPYVGGGLGIARTSIELDVVQPLAGPSIFPPIEGLDGSRTHTGMAASAGVGTSLRVFRTLFVDVDARYFRLDRDRNLARFGGGVSYRF